MNIILQIIGTIGSAIGIYLNAKKKKICWWIWIGTNFFWAWLYIRTGLFVAITSLIIYQVFNYVGWLNWRKDGTS